MSNQATAKGERNDLGGKSGRNNRPGQSSTPAQQTRQAPPSPSADKSLPPTSPINGSPIAPQNPPRGGRPVNGAGPAHGSSVPAVAVPPARTHSAPPNLTMPPHQPIYFPEKGPVPPPMAAYGKQYPFFPHSGAFPPGMPYFMPGPMPHMPQFAQPGPSTGVPPMGPPPVSRPGPQQPQSPLAPPVSSSPTAPSPAMKMPQSPAAALAPSAPSPSAPASPSVLTPPAIVGIQPAAFQRPPVYQPPTASPTPPVAKKVSRAIQIIDPTTGQALVLGGAKPAAPASPAAPVVAPAAPTPTPVPAVAPAPVPVPAPAHPHPHPVHKSSAIVIQQPTAEMLAAHLSHQHHHGHAPASPAAPAGRSSTSGAAPAEAAPKAADAKPAAPPKEEKAPATPTPAPAPAPAPAVAVPAPAKEESKPAPVAAAVDASAAPKEAKAEQPAKEAEKSAPTPAPAKEDKAAPAPAPTPATATPVSTPATTAPAAPAATAATPASTPAPKEEKAPAAAPTAAVESEKEREEAKARSRKEILKQADRGDYKARTFDAYADAKPEAAPAPAAAKPAVPEPTRPKDAARATPPPAAERKSPAPSGAGAAEEEDSWEAKDVNTLVKSIPKPDVSASRLGKIMYDRDFLLRFQTVCTEQPPNFPPFASIIGDAPSRADRGPSDRDRGGRGGGGGEDKWERGKPVAPSRGGGRGGPPPGLGAGRGGSSRGGDRGGREVPQRRPILKKGAKAPPVLEKVAPLVASSNRWVRPSNKEADTNTLTLRKSQGLLNKLTLENFDSVSEQIISHITSLDLLSGIITQVFDKALSEPHFCPMYAQLCLKISTKSLGDLGAKAEAPTTPDGKADPAAQPKKGSQFTRLLLTRCQDEFEKSSKPEELPANLSAPEREELETKHRRRVLGNIKFIGELFKLGMLTEKIMHDCITRLLGNVKNPVPEDIEALSKLMTTIGERIDHPKAAKYMDAYFARITELSQNKKLPSRLRFMLKDLIELRAHKWVARRKVEGPKAHTTQSSERDEEDAPPPRAAPAFGGGRGGGRSVTIAPRGSLDKDFRSSDRDRDRDRDHGGFRGGRTPAPAPARTPAAAPTRSANANAFSLLGREQEERYTSGGKRDLSELSLGPGGQAHATVGASGAKGWAKPEAAHKATAKTAAAAAPAAAAPAAVAPAAAVEARPAEKEAVAPVAVSAADLAAREADRERLEGEVVSILEEYLSSKEEGEAVECIKELSAPWFHADLVCQLIVAAFERKDDADRDSTRRLLAKLHEAKVLTADDIEQGMGKVAEVLPDIALDSPRCVEFFAAFVADALHERCITAAVFRLLTTEELVGNGTAKAFLGEALLALTDLCDSPERELPALVPNLDFCVFFKPKERTATQLMSWLKEKELLTVFPFAPAARLVEEHFNKSGATNAADLETWLQDAVDAEAFEEQPEGALNLVRHVTKQVLAHAFPALDAAASAANDATRAAPYASLLKKLAVVHPQGGVALLGAVRDFASRANAPAAVASAALRVLVTSKVLPPGSLKKWAAEEKDKALVAQLSAEPWWDAR